MSICHFLIFLRLLMPQSKTAPLAPHLKHEGALQAHCCSSALSNTNYKHITMMVTLITWELSLLQSICWG